MPHRGFPAATECKSDWKKGGPVVTVYKGSKMKITEVKGRPVVLFI